MPSRATPRAHSTKRRRQIGGAGAGPASPAPATNGSPGKAPPAPETEKFSEAVSIYEQGLAALQGHEYARASALLRSVLSRFPEEKELHERARLYLNVCERQMLPQAGGPISPEQRVVAATMAFNSGNLEHALMQLRAAADESPDHDFALYMLAAVHAARGEPSQAVPFLLRSIELNPDNRAIAKHDPDLDALRELPDVRSALQSTPSEKSSRKRRRAR